MISPEIDLWIWKTGLTVALLDDTEMELPAFLQKGRRG